MAMTLSPEFIAEKLQPFFRIAHYQGEKRAVISGVRFYSDNLPFFSPEDIYVIQKPEDFLGSSLKNCVLLVYSEGFILIYRQKAEEVTNSLLALFDYYNRWEAALWDAAEADNALQRMVDLSVPIFGAPIFIANIDGRVLAHNEVEDTDDTLDDLWKEIHQTNMVSLTYAGSPVLSLDNKKLEDWTTTPMLYRLIFGNVYIAANINTAGEPVATIYIEEHSRKLNPSDCEAAVVLCKVLTHVINTREDLRILTIDSILVDFIEGKKETNTMPITIGKKIPSPWKLITIRNIAAQASLTRRRRLMGIIKNMNTLNTVFLYGQEVLAIVSENQVNTFLAELLKIIVIKYYAIGISMQFAQLTELRSRYRQAIAAIDEGTSGVHDASIVAYTHLLKIAREANRDTLFQHPALQILKAYDTAHNTELYKTLFEYLYHGHNKNEAARVLFLHRNSLNYRLNKIKELTGAKFDNPDEQNFALLSFLLEEPEP
ncbi:PucR family transcriptional regulator [Treponema primitia]|nr:helix-turn-helix domain-containing protein [Treponema primitia]